MSEGLRVQKIIADAGICSRREAEEIIKSGDVTINGKVAALGSKAVAGKDHIKVRGKLLVFAAKKVVIALFKPRDLLSFLPVDARNGEGTVYSLLMPVKERVIPIGRLDKDTEGLLLLSNDGELAHRLTAPKFEVPKVYKVKIDGHLDEKREKRLLAGVRVDGKKIKVSSVRKFRETEGKEWIEIKTTESQNRIIRRLFEAVGRPVDKVRRTSFCGVSTKGLERGEWRFLSREEVLKLYEFVGMEIK
jgi:23S rRNA pseudouridine2605 synthase